MQKIVVNCRTKKRNDCSRHGRGTLPSRIGQPDAQNPDDAQHEIERREKVPEFGEFDGQGESEWLRVLRDQTRNQRSR